MLITDKETLKQFSTSKRLWQGIPSIEVTEKGRIFLTWYSGGTTEQIGNYSFFTLSDDGVNFSEPVIAAYADGYRCFDPCLWIDPLGRLWFTWSRHPDDGLYGAICDDPDADEIVFGEEFFIGNNIMMNKPTVLSTGEWLFPIAVWNVSVKGIAEPQTGKSGAFVYSTCDNGKTFKKLGGADIKKRSFDEHMILELSSGVLRNFVRTHYGIGAADSYDMGLSWGKDFDTGYKGPCSRFHIRRLKSGRVLLINHYEYTGRNNLTAMLSEDDGKTFPYKLLLDERRNVSYPDAKEAEDGFIYITYDRERGNNKSSLSEVMQSAREILIAKITEEDIINGFVITSGSYLKRVANKLGDYDGEDKNPYRESGLFDDKAYAEYLIGNKTPDGIISEIFNTYGINCTNIHNVNAIELDRLIDDYVNNQNFEQLPKIIEAVRSASDKNTTEKNDIVEKVCAYIKENLEKNESIDSIARTLNYSAHYISHIFKEKTGTTVLNFRNNQRLTKAKLLLKGGNSKIIDIAYVCGFENSAYFTEIFTREVGISPTEYRKKNSWFK